jgi:CDP-diacylglycerol--serine O-phosphatidyltransferase
MRSPNSGSQSEGPAGSVSAGGKQRKRRRGVAVLPALFTLGNLLCGFTSLNFSSRRLDLANQPAISHFAMAGYFIFLAMLFDMFDGFVARITRSTSDFGAELDSLADMVSFGVAPAFLSVHLIGYLQRALTQSGAEYYALPGPFSDDEWLRLFWVIAGIYVACTALRLARFNVITQHDVLSHMSFRGMPSPAAASVVAGTVIFYEALRAPRHVIPLNVSPQVHETLETVFKYLLPAVLLIAAMLMVSRFRYPHLINRFLRGRKKFRTLVGFVMLAMVVIWQPQISVIAGIYIYALSAPATYLFQILTGKRPQPPLPPGAEAVASMRRT